MGDNDTDSMAAAVELIISVAKRAHAVGCVMGC